MRRGTTAITAAILAIAFAGGCATSGDVDQINRRLDAIDGKLEAVEQARRDHMPALVHVTELTQPLGHSSSGSHERYKSAERLAWEEEYDGLKQMRGWMLREQVIQLMREKIEVYGKR